MKSAGYRTYMAGKWHCGLATPDHTPHGRGYEKSLCYFDGGNDYWTSTVANQGYCIQDNNRYTDLWNGTQPAYGHNNSWACSQANQPASCVYEDELFTEFLLDAIAEHDANTPMFMYFAPHNVHTQLEVPDAFLKKFSFIPDTFVHRFYVYTILSFELLQEGWGCGVWSMSLPTLGGASHAGTANTTRRWSTTWTRTSGGLLPPSKRKECGRTPCSWAPQIMADPSTKMALPVRQANRGTINHRLVYVHSRLTPPHEKKRARIRSGLRTYNASPSIGIHTHAPSHTRACIWM